MSLPLAKVLTFAEKISFMRWDLHYPLTIKNVKLDTQKSNLVIRLDDSAGLIVDIQREINIYILRLQNLTFQNFSSTMIWEPWIETRLKQYKHQRIYFWARES